MINIDLKDDNVSLLLDGKYSKVMTEVFIALVKLADDEPDTIKTTLNFLKLLEVDFRNGLKSDIIINNLMGSFYKIHEKEEEINVGYKESW